MQTFIITKGWGGGGAPHRPLQAAVGRKKSGVGFREESRDPPVPPCLHVGCPKVPQRPHVPILGVPNSPNTPMSPY